MINPLFYLNIFYNLYTSDVATARGVLGRGSIPTTLTLSFLQCTRLRFNAVSKSYPNYIPPILNIWIYSPFLI